MCCLNLTILYETIMHIEHLYITLIIHANNSYSHDQILQDIYYLQGLMSLRLMHDNG